MVIDGLAHAMAKSKPLAPGPVARSAGPVVVPPPKVVPAKMALVRPPMAEAKAKHVKPVVFSKSAAKPPPAPPAPTMVPASASPWMALPVPAVPRETVKEEKPDVAEVGPLVKVEAEPEEPPAEHVEKILAWSERLKCFSRSEPAKLKHRRLEDLRAALKADLAREELLAEQQRKHSDLAHRREQSESLRQTAGRVLALDLTSNLRDVRMLSSCGSLGALEEALAELLITMRRALALCQNQRCDKKQLEDEHRDLCEREDAEGRQRRLALIRQLAKAKQEMQQLEEEEETQGNLDYAELVSVCGVPLLAEIAHEASEAGIDISTLSTQLSQCVLQGADLHAASVAAEELRSLMAEAQIQQPPVEKPAAEAEAKKCPKASPAAADRRQSRSLRQRSRSRSRRSVKKDTRGA